MLHVMRAVFSAGAAANEERSASSEEALLSLMGAIADAQPGLAAEVRSWLRCVLCGCML
jgi:hypothetical protein